MTGRGVPDDEMLYFPWRTRPQVRGLDALLSGNYEPEDAPAGLRPVTDILAALQAPPDASEFGGWSQALAAFRETPRRPSTSHHRPRSRRPIVVTTLLTARLAAAAAAVAAAAVGGGAAAAYTGSLPAALQKVAHEVIAAPDVRTARPTPTPASRPAGPDVTGSAAHGVCTAYRHAEMHGNAIHRAAAFRDLVTAAGGEAAVPAYCRSLPRPGAGAARGRAPGRPGWPGFMHHGRPSPADMTSPADVNLGTPGVAPSWASGWGPTTGSGQGNGGRGDNW